MRFCIRIRCQGGSASPGSFYIRVKLWYPMQELKFALTQEQPRINAALERFAAELPAGSRPVAAHVLSAGGKRLRPFLTLLCGRALGSQGDGLYCLGAAVELLHAATLLHDDILDHAELRRGTPAAHTVFAQNTVILAGDAMLAKAMHMISRFSDARLTDCISEAVMKTAEGQIAEFAHLRDPDLNHEDYIAVITGKTAWMLRASCELGAAYSGAGEGMVQAAARFGLELGIAFQIVDDALDYLPGTGKPRGGDLKEGKVTPPLMFYIDSLGLKEAAAFKERFRGATFSDEEIEDLCETICRAGHTDRTREKARAHLELAATSLQLLPQSPEREIMQQMLEYILKRDH